MKKDRNTFFSNPNYQNPMMNNGMMNTAVGFSGQPNAYGSTSMNSSYYSGPDIASSNELDNRLSKIERQINRLDNRLSKLEQSTTQPTEINENNISNNMYML